jgi:O-methyltransferase involved in polyketide biosynthesis
MTEAAARTSNGTVFVIAIEQSFPRDQRIIDDDLALQIMPLSYRIFALVMRIGFIRDWMIKFYEKRWPGVWGGLLCRKRYITDKLNNMAPPKLMEWLISVLVLTQEFIHWIRYPTYQFGNLTKILSLKTNKNV